MGSVAHQPANFHELTDRISRRNPGACRQGGKLDAAAGEECIACDEEGIRALTRQSGKDRIDFANRSGVEDVELQPDRAGSLLHISQCGFNNRSIPG